MIIMSRDVFILQTVFTYQDLASKIIRGWQQPLKKH